TAVNAMTLSPTLTVVFLKPHTDENKKKNFLQRLYAAFIIAFGATTTKYRKSVSFLIHRKWIALVGIAAFAGLFFYLNATRPAAFVPNEDTGSIMEDLALPVSSSLERTEQVAIEVENIVRSLREVQNVLRVTGNGMISGRGSNYAMLIIRLKDWSERGEKNQSVEALIGTLFAKTSSVREAKVIYFAPPTIQGFGVSQGFEFQLQDRTGSDIAAFTKVGNDFIAALNERPEIQYASTTFDPNFPQYQIDVNVEKAK